MTRRLLMWLFRCCPCSAFAADKVVFVTSWFAEAEHGGFYQALAEGIYQKHGLDVTLAFAGHPAGIAMVINGEAQLSSYNLESVMQGSYEDWQYILNTNLLGYMACCNEAVKRMSGISGSHIINIGSISADERAKDSSVYVATKAGVQGFNESLRKEVNAQGIKVSLIEPGLVGSDMVEEDDAGQRQKIAAMEMLKAEDIAAGILYCLSQPLRCDVIGLQIRPHLQII